MKSGEFTLIDNTAINNELNVAIAREMVDLIQGLQYEIATREKIVTNILTTPGMNVNKELFDSYQKELSSYAAQYELAKSNLEKIYMPEEFKKLNTEINWRLDFTTGIATFSVATIGELLGLINKDRKDEEPTND